MLVWLYFNPLPHFLRLVNLRLEIGWEAIVRNGIHVQMYLSKDNEWGRLLRVLACQRKFEALLVCFFLIDLSIQSFNGS